MNRAACLSTKRDDNYRSDPGKEAGNYSNGLCRSVVLFRLFLRDVFS